MQPKCFTHESDWKAWRGTEGAGKPAYGYCTDCMPSHKERMLVEGRCEQPRTQFRTTDSGSVEGYRPAYPPELRKAETIVGRASDRVIAVYAVSGQIRTLDVGSQAQRRQSDIGLVGIYGPGARAEDIADDLRAAA